MADKPLTLGAIRGGQEERTAHRRAWVADAAQHSLHPACGAATGKPLGGVRVRRAHL